MTETETHDARGDDDCGCGPGGGRARLAHVLLWQAERAKMDLLREKVKKHLEAKRGQVYDKIAEVLADHLVRLAQRAADDRGSYDDLNERLQEILEGGGKK